MLRLVHGKLPCFYKQIMRGTVTLKSWNLRVIEDLGVALSFRGQIKVVLLMSGKKTWSVCHLCKWNLQILEVVSSSSSV